MKSLVRIVSEFGAFGVGKIVELGMKVFLTGIDIKGTG
jgi:hypothetical protein